MTTRNGTHSPTVATEPPDIPGFSAADWITLTEATKLLPSCRPGKRLHVCTLYRWIQSGKLDCWRIGRWRFVRRAQVLAMIQPAEKATNPPDEANSYVGRTAADRAWEKQKDEILKKLKLR